MYITVLNDIALASQQVYTTRMLSSVVYDQLIIESLLITASLPQEKQGKCKLTIVKTVSGTYTFEFTRPYEMWLVSISNDKQRPFFMVNKEDDRISLEFYKTDKAAYTAWRNYEQRYNGNSSDLSRKARSSSSTVITRVGDIETIKQQANRKNDRRNSGDQSSNGSISHGQSVLEIVG